MAAQEFEVTIPSLLLRKTVPPVHEPLGKRVPPSVITGVNPLPPEEALPVAQELLKGNFLDWSYNRSAFTKSLSYRNSQGARLAVTIVDHHNDQTAQAVRLFTQDISGIDSAKTLEESQKAFIQFMNKMKFIDTLCFYAHYRAGKLEVEVPPELQELTEVFNQQVQAVSRFLNSLTNDDLSLFFRYESALWHTGGFFSQPVTILRNSKTHQDLFTSLPTEYVLKKGAVEQEILRAQEETVDRLRNRWSWKDIVHDISSLGHGGRFIYGGAYVYDHIVHLRETEEPMDNGVFLDSHWIDGLIVLLTYRLASQMPVVRRRYPDIAETFVNSPDAKLPSSYPVVAVRFLEKFAAIEGEKTLQEVLTRIAEKVSNNKNSSSACLTTLVAVQKLLPQISLGAIISSLSSLDKRIRAVAMNQEPGELYLTTEGDVVVGKRTGAFLLHTSSKPKEPEVEVVPKVVPETPKEAPPPVLIRITKKPFVGTVDVIEEPSVPYVLDFWSGKINLGKEGDELLDAFSALSEQWKYRIPSHMTLIYLPELNKLDPVLIKAAKMGIGAVTIDRSNHGVTFLSKDRRTAIEALLTPSGELEIPGARDGFIGSALHLYLNILSLGLAMRVFYQGVPKDNTLTAAWNRTMCSDLPRLRKATMQDDTSIAIPATFANDELQVLLIEEA